MKFLFCKTQTDMTLACFGPVFVPKCICPDVGPLLGSGNSRIVERVEIAQCWG